MDGRHDCIGMTCSIASRTRHPAGNEPVARQQTCLIACYHRRHTGMMQPSWSTQRQ